MNKNNAASAYLENSIETAPPIKIVRLLYEGAIRYLDKAATFEPGSSDMIHWLHRAEDIVIELQCSLEFDHDPAICTQLSSLYDFVRSQLSKVQLDKDEHGIRNSRRVLTTLLDGWKKVQLETTDTDQMRAAG